MPPAPPASSDAILAKGSSQIAAFAPAGANGNDDKEAFASPRYFEGYFKGHAEGGLAYRVTEFCIASLLLDGNRHFVEAHRNLTLRSELLGRRRCQPQS